ncbi:hypothetical protein RI129_007474 [Pyrocoelia pectoralis]|uniref:Carboxylic ester hydrolase n=1 Tax=Pyrocoelia pectoralis TaxID=417401 RepID=A0AAN7VCF3_9COLE
MEKCVLYFYIIIATFYAVSSNELIVNTAYGKIRGVSETAATGKQVNVWYGIPYAEKPIGNLRFRPSSLVKPWKNTLDASKIPPACIQTKIRNYDNFPGEEILSLSYCGCSTISSKNASVMVWIHGGGFYMGSNSLSFYDHKILATEENVIVASMQYRLGAFGFLSLEKDILGNAGFFDQVLALRWIKDNIDAFGGNPDSITIFGESAGSGAVSHHLLSPLSSKLFSRGIMQSGVVTSSWAVVPSDINIARSLKVVHELGCPDDVKLMVECLEKADAELIIAGQNTIPPKGVVSIPFYPVVDGTFIVRDPLLTLKSGLYDQRNVILGSNEHEGHYFLLLYAPRFNYENLTVTRGRFIEEIPKILPIGTLETEAVIFEYTDWNNPNDVVKNLDALQEMVGDWYFTCSVYDFANLYSEKNNVFLYHYKHKNHLHLWPLWAGAMHGDEIVFIFGEPLNPTKNYKMDQINFSRQMMRYWANFARTGNPNCVSFNDCQWTWPSFTPNNPSRINLDIKDFTISNDLRARKCAFWKEYMPKLKKFSCKYFSLCITFHRS